MGKENSMERITLDPFKCFYCCFFIVLLLLGRTESKEYIVGDEDEWNSGSNHQRWSQKYNFSIGDVLEFDYVKGQHNVKEVTEITFRTCDTEISGAVLEKYESGHDKVCLTQARNYWFVCDVPGHCTGGMKFGIQVTNADTTAPHPCAP
ncbi:basic blue protein-like [Papaver somniferum]|uniref:basic blue protein-like n=1 Tax=Papaver somniferum TaxID=3469 RepID=UPI000E6FD8E6|nr:basic blue protein-like [Papaver somniferum]